MNYKPKKPCSYPGCPEIVESGTRYCSKHKLKEQQRYDKQRGTAKQRGYDARWQRVRKIYLGKHPLCENCLLEDTIKAAILVHHKVPISEGGDKYNFDNLESLCTQCHDKKHKDKWRRK